MASSSLSARSQLKLTSLGSPTPTPTPSLPVSCVGSGPLPRSHHAAPPCGAPCLWVAFSSLHSREPQGRESPP